MTPRQAIAMLDDQIRRHGRSVTYHVMTAGAPDSGAPVRGFVRGMKPDELVGDVTQKDRKVSFSPTYMPTVPAEGCRLVIDGKAYRAQLIEPIEIDNVLVRINIMARG